MMIGYLFNLIVAFYDKLSFCLINETTAFLVFISQINYILDLFVIY